MGVAIGCSLLLILTALHQFSYNRFHKNKSQLYKVYQEIYAAKGTEIRSNMPVPLQPVLEEEMPQIQHAIRWLSSGVTVEYEGKIYYEGIRYTDEAFFEAFTFPLIEGNASTVLSDLNNIVISEEIAQKLFPNGDPLNKVLSISAEGRRKEFVVKGVVQKYPANSSLKYGLITRFENSPSYLRDKNSWNNFSHDLFVQLPKGVEPESLQEGFKIITEKYFTESIENIKREGANPGVDGEVIKYQLQPLSDLHFNSAGVGGNGISKAFPIGLLIISAFILAIACINFVNLTLGSSLSRAKEVGVRKVLGANKRQLLAQFWGEALLTLGIALLVGTALAQWIMPEFNATFRQSLSLAQPRIFLALGAIMIFAGLSGGGYPAIILSRFPAADVLKRNTRLQKPGRMRNLLLIVQFCLSILLISCTIIVYQQIQFLRNKPLGFNKEEVLSIPIGEEMDSKQTMNRLRNELESYPNIKSISASYTNMGMGEDGSQFTSIMAFQHNEKIVKTHWNRVDYDYFKTLEIPIVEGRTFSREHPTDSSSAIIINETFAQQLGTESAIGQKLGSNPPLQVIGVMKDHHFKSLNKEIEPLSAVMNGGGDFRLTYAFIRMNADGVPNTVDQIEKSWKSINPGATFQASFLNENTDRLYKLEEMMGKLFFSAAALAIILSCMGLFGIVLLVIAQRTKEIGIRKVLGASVTHIISLVSKDFLQIVLVSILVATPLAWLAMNSWLNTYAYGVDINWWVFALAGLLALLIAFVTMGAQSLRAATINPVDSLRDE